jgi:glycosyltransferase involved in cell wall biosynthesis
MRSFATRCSLRINISILCSLFLLDLFALCDKTYPLLSVILFTNRPGGVDLALESLSLQDSRDYELIIIDDSRGERRDAIISLARNLSLNLQHVVSSKTKTSLVSAPGGEANAMNTGLLLARGVAVAFLNDFTWLPDRFVSLTNQVRLVSSPA